MKYKPNLKQTQGGKDWRESRIRQYKTRKKRYYCRGCKWKFKTEWQPAICPMCASGWTLKIGY
jgi:rubrerythrin